MFDFESFRLNINITEQFTCLVDDPEELYVPLEFESRSEGGFLLGDPLLSRFVLENVRSGPLAEMKFGFVLNKHTVFRSDDDRVEMLNTNEQQEDEKKVAHTIVKQVVFSLSGETIYVVSRDDDFIATTTVAAWNVSSTELIARTIVDAVPFSSNCILAVKGGVLMIERMGTLQMWNFESSKCVRRWTNIGIVTDVIPISEERVACTTEENLVIILDTTSGEILLTMQTDRTSSLLACNSKFQILTSDMGGLVRLSDRETMRWGKQVLHDSHWFGLFSPAETFVIIFSTFRSRDEIFVLDAVSGKTFHVLGSGRRRRLFCACKFVSDEECVVISKASSEQCRAQLFNVKSGDLLGDLPLSNLLPITSLTGPVNSLAASPCKRLVAIYPIDSKHGYEVIQVRLPVTGKAKGLSTPENTEKYKQENKRCVLV